MAWARLLHVNLSGFNALGRMKQLQSQSVLFTNADSTSWSLSAQEDMCLQPLQRHTGVMITVLLSQQQQEVKLTTDMWRMLAGLTPLKRHFLMCLVAEAQM